MGSHIIEFQSDKYPSCPRGKVPLSVKDPKAQDLLFEYAQRRREVDAEFADDLETALVNAGYPVVTCAWCRCRHKAIFKDTNQGVRCASSVSLRDDGRWIIVGSYGSVLADDCLYVFTANVPTDPADPVCDVCFKARIDAGDLELVSQGRWIG